MEAQVTSRPGRVPVRQFTIFSDNRVGRLNELLQRFAAGGVHVLAICQIDCTESTLIRCVVDYHETACEVLQQHGYAYGVNEICAVEVPSVADLRQVTCALVEAEINIHYVYPFFIRPGGKCALALHLEDNELAGQVLAAHGLQVLDQHDIAR
jgi:hypothetical protein